METLRNNDFQFKRIYLILLFTCEYMDIDASAGVQNGFGNKLN